MESLIYKIGIATWPIFRHGRSENDRLPRTGTEIIGLFSQIDPLDKHSKWAKLRGRIERLDRRSVGFAFVAGTDDNQRNIIGQFAMQLPKSY